MSTGIHLTKRSQKTPSRRGSGPKPAAGRVGRPPGDGASRQKIMEAATRLFADRGYAALSMRDITAACRLNAPSIYHFFGGKENLYRSCCNAEFAQVSARLRAALEIDGGAKARIEAFTIGLCEALLARRGFRRLLLQEIIVRDESRHFEELSTNFFLPEYRLLVVEIAALTGRRGAAERAFSIYALTFGLILLRRTFAVAGVGRGAALAPARLASRVLGNTLPTETWLSRGPRSVHARQQGQ